MSATFPKAGPAGPAGISPYVHTQSVPSSSFVIAHGQGRQPVNAEAFDSGGHKVIVGVRIVDANHVEITTETGLPFSGKVLVI